MADERNPSLRQRGGPDLVALVSGLITVAIAGSVLIGLGSQLQWLLALAAVTVGIVMLVVSLRTRS
ncbi:hypothetical protein SAMN02982929_06120 [Saccharopolyspora kobensis]|uniref:Uncharacterized protein n=1 Tax=Saccharopolyspora kobensis TaxID=146035 RepID=A0A1H6EBR5_9PSEU|nr:hypothetical protein [Saccharopolyspora kobensis]SEG95207.1 hypothetical protein SAMN02982929_06120 [Saccharopolyspora kobensis]SFD59069.1 hypothetical protein SAMN05216506_105166 [Saccharopolyspora kobensis]